MRQHLESKTIAGLTVMLLLASGMALAGKLTPELVDVLKWLGTAFMGVRGVANFTEGRKQ